ncbi:hypothetical protein FRX31_017017, partial [Thalictrum thalictroides]
QPYEEALQHLFNPNSKVIKSKTERKKIAERIGKYILKMLGHIIRFLMELVHEKCWDGEVATLIVEGLKEVPEQIVITIPELVKIINDAKDVCNTCERWQATVGEVVKNRVWKWKWTTRDLDKTIKKWEKCPTSIFHSLDEKFRMGSAN